MAATKRKKVQTRQQRQKQLREPMLPSPAFLLEKGWGRFLLCVLMALLLVGLDLLISQNRLELFALLFGLELIVVLVAAWSLYLWSRSRAARRAEAEEEG